MNSNSAIFDLAAWLTQNALNLVLQSTALIAIGLFAASLLRRKGSAVQSTIYRATLLAVFVCPVTTWVMQSAGFSGWNLSIPDVRQSVETESDSFEPQLATRGQNPTLLPLQIDPMEDSSQAVPTEYTRTPTETAEINFTPSIPSLKRLPDSRVTRATAKVDAFHSEAHASTHGRSAKKSGNRFAIALTYSLLGVSWIVGSFILLTRLLVAFVKIEKLRKESLPAAESEIEICGNLARTLNLPTPDVRRNSLISSPLLMGVSSPTILLPVELKDRHALQKAFAHELGHLQRSDACWNLLQRAALAIFFFQPLLWKLVQRLEMTAEEVCDDLVVKHCRDRAGYAQQLVELAESNLLTPNAAGLGMFTSKISLKHRVIRILDSTRQLSTQVSIYWVVVIAAISFSAALLGGLIGVSPINPGSKQDSAATKNADFEEEIRVVGKITDPQGRPVSQAEIKVMPSVNHLFRTFHIKDAYTQTTSGPDGSFEVVFSKSRLMASGHPMIQREENFSIVVTKPGLGMAWANADDMTARESIPGEPTHLPVEIQMVESKTPIQLSIVDTEGNAIPNARVKVTAIQTLKNNDIKTILMNAEKQTPFREGYVAYLDDFLSLHGLEEFVADENGNVTIEDIGDHRSLDIEINGDSICSTVANILVIDHETISFPYTGMLNHDIVFHGANTTFSCEPMQPITGRVVDSKTQKPLAGVAIYSSKFAGESISGINRLRTETDAEGRFELLGMPKGPGNTICVVPSDDHPYFMTRYVVPEGEGLRPVDVQIEMERGVLIRGKATDKGTGEPIVGARLFYLPYLSNDFANQSTVFGDNQFMEIQSRYTTHDDGTFQLVGLPGRALVGILDIDGTYPTGQGWEKVPEEDKDPRGHVRTHHQPITPSPKWPTAMQEVNISEDAPEHSIDFQLTSGISIPIRVVSPDGEPLSGVSTKRLRSDSDNFYETEDSLVNAMAFAPGEKRLICFHHKSKALSRVIELDSTQWNPDSNRKPMEVKLSPNTMVKGRLVNRDGDPIAHGSILFRVGGGRDFGIDLDSVATDENGNFIHTQVFPGTFYSISAQTPGEIFLVTRRLTVDKSEVIDLGTINIDDLENSPEPDRKPLTAPERPQEEPPQDNKSPKPNLTFSGTITDQNLRAIPEVTVELNTWGSYANPNRKTIATTVSNSDGEFDLRLSSTLEARLNDANSDIQNASIIIRSAGWAGQEFPLVRFGKKQLEKVKAPLRVKLERENRITGQIVDLEGTPISNAKVFLSSIRVIDEERASRWMKKLQETKKYRLTTDLLWSSSGPLLYGNSGLVPHSFLTNPKGQFEVAGLPKNAVINFRVEHPKVTTQPFQVINRPLQEALVADYTVYGDHPLVVTQPSRPIFGTIVDAITGEPISGVRVRCSKMGTKPTVYSTSAAPETFTDSAGKFKLVGMPKSLNSQLTVYPPSNSQYLIRQVHDIPDTVGIQPAKIEVKLEKGIWISGKVVDKATQKGVEAQLRYFPLRSNPVFRASKAYQSSNFDDESTFFEHYKTNADGTFRIVGLPGKAVLGAMVNHSEYRSGAGYEKVLETLGEPYPDYLIDSAAKTGQDLRDQLRLDLISNYSLRNVTGSSYVALNIPPPKTEWHLDHYIELDPGREVELQVVDPQGRKINQVSVANYDGFRGTQVFEGDRVTLTKMGEDERRRIHLYNQELGLAKIQFFEAGKDASAPVDVMLSPLVQLQGRLVDPHGIGLQGYQVVAGTQKATTGVNGQILIRDFVFEKQNKVQLSIFRPSDDDRSPRKGNFLQVGLDNVERGPANIFELGDVTVDPNENWWVSGSVAN